MITFCTTSIAKSNGQYTIQTENESSAIAMAQEVRISGRTIAMPEEVPLGYVNIGIVGSNIGTVSDEEGFFSMRVPRNKIDEIVVFSALGFTTEERTVRELFQSTSRNTIYLTERALELGEVGISASRLEEEEIGIMDTGFNWISAGVENKSPGFELAMKMEARRYPSILQNLRFYVNYNPGRSAIIRINVYENDNGVPGQNIVRENIIFRTTQKNGWVRLNLEPYRVVVQNDFFIGLEWIENLEGEETFSMYLAGKRKKEYERVVYTRLSRHDTWLESDRLDVVLNMMVIN